MSGVCCRGSHSSVLEVMRGVNYDMVEMGRRSTSLLTTTELFMRKLCASVPLLPAFSVRAAKHSVHTAEMRSK